MPRKSADAVSKVVKKIPTSENGPGVHCTTKSGSEYFITQCLEKARFTLWHKSKDGYEQLATAKSPLELDNKIPWEE